MTQNIPPKRGRGRPPKTIDGREQTREALLRAGVEILTEKGFAATGIDQILRQIGVPKGSFYHYFASKEAFGAEVIQSYADYFAAKLDRHLLDSRYSPLDRLHHFVADARAGMGKHGFRRGCLIGNLGQEMGVLPESYRTQLIGVFIDWEARLAACLALAKVEGQIDPQADAAQWARFFWLGWEGAVLRAKLALSDAPLEAFYQGFLTAIQRD